MNDIYTGARHAIGGFGLIFKPRIRALTIMPIALTTIFYVAMSWYAWEISADWLDSLNEALPSWLSWLNWILVPIMILGGILLMAFTFGIVAALLGTPFNGLLAELVEAHITGQTQESIPWRRLLLELPGTLVQETKKILYYILWMIPCLLLFLVPGLNIAAPFVWVFFCSWMLTVEFSDYPMGNHQLLFSEMRGRLGKQRLLALGFGLTVLGLFTVPILNILVMPAAVCGATTMWIDRFRDA